MQVADQETVLGDFDDAEFDYFGQKTRFFRRDNEFIVATQDADGQEQEYKVTYTFGVTPLQQYLVEFPGGRKQALPFSWDTRPAADGGMRWFHLYPDEYIGPGDELHWTGRYQNWNYMCAECHSTNLQMGYDSDTDTFTTTYSELSVGCDACHGPGSEHISQANADAFDSQFGLAVNLSGHKSNSWVMNPQSGIAERGEPLSQQPQEPESCGQCHARRGLITSDYEYGKPLADTHLLALLDEHLYFSDGQIKDEVYVYGSFIQSRMYQAGVTCSNCHDPHSGSLRTGSTPSDVCSLCHLPTKFASRDHSGHASTDANCVDCHMASRTYMGVDGRRDHSFRIPRPDLHEETGAPNACANCHADKDAAWATSAVDELHPSLRSHYGSVIAAGREKYSNELLLAPPFREEDTSAVENAIADSDPLIRIAALRTLRAFPAETKLGIGGESLHDPIRSVRLQAALAFADIRDLLPLEQARAFGRAAEEYRSTYTMLASTPDALMNLGNFELAVGDTPRATAYFEQAVIMDPGFVPARLNLVDVLRLSGNEIRVEALLLEGISITPNNAALHHSLGLALIRSRQTEAGLEELRKASDLEPTEQRYVYVLGIALNSLGQQDEALTLLENAFQEFPTNYDIGWALATILRDAGDFEHAKEVVDALGRSYPDDSNITALRQWLVARPISRTN